MATSMSQGSGEDVDDNDVVEDENGKTILEKKVKMKTKKKKPGVIYLSTIPPGMDVQSVRNIFSKFGTVGRMYLQPYPEKGESIKKMTGRKQKKRHQNFCEGWVEFLDKKTAKGVATLLNNKLIGGKRKSKFHDYIWNIKYLHRFKWIHLNERVAYEKASHLQRMRTEIAQVKKETDYYVETVERSRNEEEFRHRRHPGYAESTRVVRQRYTDEEIRRKKQSSSKADDEPTIGPDLELLQSVFGSK